MVLLYQLVEEFAIQFDERKGVLYYVEVNRHIWLFLIVLMAGLLRFVSLTSVPPALNSDEVAIGYNAYSILTTGRDEYGVKYPLTFRSFDDYKMPVYVYMVAGSMKIFGFGDFAIRFPSAFFGTLTVFLTYYLVLQLFKHQAPITNNQTISKSKAPNTKQNDLGFGYWDLQKIALLSAMLLAISPWHIFFSRSGYEANVAVFFVVAATYFFLRKSFLFSAVLFSLSIWTYLTPRIFVPLLVLGLAFIYRREIWNRRVSAVAAVFVALVLLLPIAKMSLSAEGQMRAAGVSAFNNPDDLKKSADRLTLSRGIFRMLSNRRITYAQTFLRGYFSHFDPNFLFLDKSIEKYRAPDMGLLYLFELPLLLVGFYILVKKWSPGSALLFWWIVVSPVAAAFTLQLPHPVRTLVFLPAIQIITAVGLVTLWRKYRVIIAVIIGVSLLYYLRQYFLFLPIENGMHWYAGRREMTQKIGALEHDYNTIYVSNALDFPYIFYLYYSKTHPSEYLKQGGTISGGFLEQENKYGNVEFRSIHTSLRDPLKKTLFVGLPSEVFKTSLIVDTVYYPDGSPAVVFFK